MREGLGLLNATPQHPPVHVVVVDVALNLLQQATFLGEQLGVLLERPDRTEQNNAGECQRVYIHT